ncbi:MAG: stage III sporulation protein AG [Oscillospiraceae bacterium]
MKFKIDDKKLKIFVIIGLVGIALIFLSTFFSGEKKGVSIEEVKLPEGTLTNEQYEQKLETEVGELINSIEGVGKAKIMVTLLNGIEYVYATEESLNTDKTNTAEQTVAQRQSSEKKTILIEDDNGRRKALLKTTLEPTVKGVVIVCDGGNDITVQERVTEAVKAILNISSTRICVTKLS